MADTTRGRLGVAALVAETNTAVYEVTNGMDAEVDIFVTSGVGSNAIVNIAIVNGAVGAIATEDYIVFNKKINSGEYFEIKGVNLSADEAVVAYSDTANVVVRVSGVEEAAAGGGEAQELLASGGVTPGVEALELSHATVAIAAVIPTLVAHQGLFTIKNTGTGTEDHTVTATVGTFDGTNNVVTLDANNEFIAFYIDSAGDGTILQNTGTVTLS